MSEHMVCVGCHHSVDAHKWYAQDHESWNGEERWECRAKDFSYCGCIVTWSEHQFMDITDIVNAEIMKAVADAAQEALRYSIPNGLPEARSSEKIGLLSGGVALGVATLLNAIEGITGVRKSCTEHKQLHNQTLGDDNKKRCSNCGALYL